MSDLVTVHVCDSDLQAIHNPEGVWIHFRRACDTLGLDLRSQLRKLNGRAWSRIVKLTIRDTEGRNQEAMFLHLDSLPMWLATIERKKVHIELRVRLDRYQVEAAGVLHDHFLGRSTPAAPVMLPWTQRLTQLAGPHIIELNRRFPDRWSIISAILPQLLIAEDDLWRHGFPLRISDLPDGSLGQCFGRFWQTNGTRNRIQAVPLTLANVDRATGENHTCQPWLYHNDDKPLMLEWFRDQYMPDKFPPYLVGVAKRREEPIPPERLARGIYSTCHLLTGTEPRALPQKLRRALPAPAGPKQQSLF